MQWRVIQDLILLEFFLTIRQGISLKNHWDKTLN